VQAFGRRRSGDVVEGEKISDCAGRKGQFEMGSVDDSGREGSAASDFDGLGAVMGFLAAGASRGAGLGSADIFGAWKFVGRVVDYFIGLHTRGGVGAQTGDFARDHDEDEEQKCLQ